MCQEWKICIVGHPQTPWVHKARGAWDPCNTILCKARRSCVNQTCFSVSSLPKCWSQAVVCVSTPRMYSRSGYFLVFFKVIWVTQISTSFPPTLVYPIFVILRVCLDFFPHLSWAVKIRLFRITFILVFYQDESKVILFAIRVQIVTLGKFI